MKFVIFGFYENDAVGKAVEFCAKANDPEDTCRSKAQLKFVIFGFHENDAVVKPVEFCAKAKRS